MIWAVVAGVCGVVIGAVGAIVFVANAVRDAIGRGLGW